jgi:hypothetical protein
MTRGPLNKTWHHRRALQVSLVKPGMPFQVVVNLESKRKTPSHLAFYQVRYLWGIVCQQRAMLA